MLWPVGQPDGKLYNRAVRTKEIWLDYLHAAKIPYNACGSLHLAYCKEDDLISYAEHKAFPIIPCNLCGSQENLQRQSVKAMLQQWDKDTPGRTDNIFSAISKISPSQLADKDLFDFTHLTIDRLSEDKKPLKFEDNKTVTCGNINKASIVEQWVGAEEPEIDNSIQAINL